VPVKKEGHLSAAPTVKETRTVGEEVRSQKFVPARHDLSSPTSATKSAKPGHAPRSSAIYRLIWPLRLPQGGRLLRQAGWSVSDGRVERIWKREGLKVPHKQPKRNRLWLTDDSCIRLRPEHPNHV
jgi:hypothetical protein